MMTLTSLRKAAGLLQALDAAELPLPEARRHVLRTAIDDFPLDVYEPTDGNPEAPTVIVNHGLSPDGSFDPRFVKCCRAFALQGFRVLAPRYPSMTRLEITPHTVEEMVAVYNALAAGDILQPGRPVSIFGVCFSAGMGMIAANDPRVELHISSLFNLGSYSDLRRTLEGLLKEPDPRRPRDDYPRLVYLHNWLGRIVPEASPAVREWLNLAIRDNLAGGKTSFAAEYAARLAGADRELCGKLGNPGDADIRERCLTVARGNASWSARLSPRYCAGKLRIPSWIMHGRHDDVIECDESRRLERRLRSEGTAVQALYTDAIGHAGAGNVGPVRLVWEQARMAVFVAGWIDSVRFAAACAAGRVRVGGFRRRAAAWFRPAVRPVDTAARKGKTHVANAVGL